MRINTFVNKCVKAAHVNTVAGCYNRSVASGNAGADCTNTTEEFARNAADGSVDLTKTRAVVCKQHDTSSFLCVIEGFEDHATKCSEVDSGDCRADSKILNPTGDAEIDGNCGVNDYTQTCVDDSHKALPPDSCAKVTVIGKCEGLQLKENDGSVRAVCRKTKDDKKCEDAPKQKFCTYNESAHTQLVEYHTTNCGKIVTQGECTGGCKWQTNKCTVNAQDAIRQYFKGVCETGYNAKVRNTADKIVDGFARCDQSFMNVAGQNTPYFCQDR